MRPRGPPIARAGTLAVDDLAAAAGRLDPLACAGAEAVGMDGERLGQLALGQHLHGHALARGQTVGLHQLEGHLGAGVETALQGGDVDGLGVRAEGLEGHRLLHVRPAQLSHAHVDRHLPALEGCPALRARARARALLPAPSGLAGARAFAAPYALARTPAARGRRETVQPDLLLRALRGGAHFCSSTSTRWRTACSMPRACAESSTCTVWPMRRRPSERRVSSCFCLAPLLDLRWVTLRALMRRLSRPPRPAWARSPARRRCRRCPRRRWLPRRRGRAPG